MGSRKKTDKFEPEEKKVNNEKIENSDDTKVEVNFEDIPKVGKEKTKSKKAEDLKKEEAAKAYKKADKETKSSQNKKNKAEIESEDIDTSEEEEKIPEIKSNEKFKDLNDRHLRLQAEFINYKKRVEKESLVLASYLKAEIIKEFLPVFDDFKHMVENVEKDHEDVNSVLEGIHMIFKKNIQLIEKFGVKKMDCLDKEFNPEIHEALITQPVEDKKMDNIIVQVYQDGYELNEKIVRPAKVIVGKFEEKKDEKN